MKILLFGGTGFIGENLCRELLASGHDLVVITRDARRAKATF